MADVRKIALYLSGKIPPEYKGVTRAWFNECLVEVFGYTFEKIEFLWRQAREYDEEYFFSVLDVLFHKSEIQDSENTKLAKLLSLLKVPSFDTAPTVAAIGADVLKGKTLIERLNSLPKGGEPKDRQKNARDFEVLGREIFQYLLSDSFEPFSDREQVSTLSEIDIRDLLVLNAYKRDGGIVESFWGDIVAKTYDSHFIVVDFKNYTGEASQDVFVTTEKYLNRPEIGRFAFLFVRSGLDTNAKVAQRERFLGNANKSSVCMLNLDDDDLIKMLKMKMDGKAPEVYLMEKYIDLVCAM